jgi:hypothetical protein
VSQGPTELKYVFISTKPQKISSCWFTCFEKYVPFIILAEIFLWWDIILYFRPKTTFSYLWLSPRCSRLPQTSLARECCAVSPHRHNSRSVKIKTELMGRLKLGEPLRFRRVEINSGDSVLNLSPEVWLRFLVAFFTPVKRVPGLYVNVDHITSFTNLRIHQNPCLLLVMIIAFSWEILVKLKGQTKCLFSSTMTIRESLP